MSVMIRLAQAGSKKKPYFTLVVTSKASRRNGGEIARIGFYNPKAKEEKDKLTFDEEALKMWIGRGAECSPTVGTLIKMPSKALVKQNYTKK